MEKIDLKKLKGKELFDYMSSREYPDQNMASIVQMLPYAAGSTRKAYKILERVVRNDQKLVVRYVYDQHKSKDGLESVGYVLDGWMYIE